MPQHFKGKKGKARTRALVEHAFSEVKSDEPSIVGKTRRKKGAAAAERQETAIALSKARAAGANIPKKGKRPHGSGAFGNADLMKGYKTV